MAEKNAILRHVFYSAVRQAVNKTAAFLPRNWGPAILQLRSRYTATEAPLHGNGGPVMMQRRPSCTAAEARLRWSDSAVDAHRGKSPPVCGTNFHTRRIFTL